MSKSTGFAPEVAEGLHLRDGHRCSMEGFPGCPGTEQRTTDPGHRLNRGSGGDPRPFINDPANGAAQHHGCNWKSEQIDEWIEESRRRGSKLEHGEDDHRTITTTPMWSPFYGQWVLLKDDGLHLTGVRDGTLDAREAATWMP